MRRDGAWRGKREAGDAKWGTPLPDAARSGALTASRMGLRDALNAAQAAAGLLYATAQATDFRMRI